MDKLEQLIENHPFNKNNVKLILCDMDGTLLNQMKTISDGNREIIKLARKQNKLFSICTGRIPAMMQYYIEIMELETPFIAVNGAVISNPQTGEIIYDIPLEEEEAFDLMSFLKFYRMDYCALTLDRCYFSNNSLRIQRFEQYNDIAKKAGFKQIPLSHFDEYHHCVKEKNIYKILVNELIPGQIRQVEEFLKKLKKTGYTSSEPNLLDISEKRVNKGFGLLKLIDYLGLNKNNVCAFGDYYNDIPMFNIAGLPVAMENGCQEVKDNAFYVTKSNEEDGVAWFLQKYIIL